MYALELFYDTNEEPATYRHFACVGSCREEVNRNREHAVTPDETRPRVVVRMPSISRAGANTPGAAWHLVKTFGANADTDVYCMYHLSPEDPLLALHWGEEHNGKRWVVGYAYTLGQYAEVGVINGDSI